MKPDQKKENFEVEEPRTLLKTGVKYLAISVPLLFISPIVITIGFKAIKKNDNYIMIVLGLILAFFTIILVVQAFRKILKSLFSR
ncbi:MAG: hypothetical protein DRJ07_20550 [Bacteroidetes bacterium]|nr:MAG: hypothetical protein DRJ07_20550 [Bacteroidota bacterium]